MRIETLKRVTKKIAQSAGFEIHRVGIRKDKRASLPGLLHHAKGLGFLPHTVIDVGAAYGSFTLQCHEVFPDAQYVLIEPVEEYTPVLEAAVQSVGTAQYVIAAATPEVGEITINVHPDLVGSSLYLEDESSDVNGVARTVRAVSLDHLVDEKSLKPPFFIKIDAQGAELDVLAGANKALPLAEYVLIEVSLFEFFKGGPQLHDVIAYMKSKGFVAYDISELSYRLLDNALAQVDIAFVKENGFFRKNHQYATPQQREELNKRFALEVKSLANK